MPARRRRSLFRDPIKRAKMWNAKVQGDTYARQLELVKPLAVGRVMEYQVIHEQLIDTVKRLVGVYGEFHLTQEYMWYAQKLWKLAQTYRSNALQNQADALFLWYLARGLNEITLRSIARSLGINISSTNDIINRITMPIIAEGSITTNGTEQTVMEYIGTATIHGYIDLSKMESGDEVVIKVYVKVREGGEYKLHAKETYSGAQPMPALYIVPKLTGHAFKVTIQQTAGSYKSFDYMFSRMLSG